MWTRNPQAWDDKPKKLNRTWSFKEIIIFKNTERYSVDPRARERSWLFDQHSEREENSNGRTLEQKPWVWEQDSAEQFKECTFDPCWRWHEAVDWAID